MSKVSSFVRHQVQPGKRDEVLRVWERHMRPNIAVNPGHEAYFFCFDNDDSDSFCAFQQYTDLKASQDFVKTEGFAAYLKEVGPLLAGPPEITSLSPMWTKGG